MPPETKWDRFEAAAGRLDSDAEFRECVLYQWDSTYDADTGDYDHTLAETLRLRAELREPSTPRVLRSEPAGSGGDAEVDVEVFFSLAALEAAGVEIITAGGEQRPTVIEDTLSGTRYTIHETFPEGNGLLHCRGVER